MNVTGSSSEERGELYTRPLIGLLEAVWGEGWLSPGGPEEVARVLDGLDLAGLSILDIGCGVGGIDAVLVEQHRAGFVLGIDVEDTVLAAARRRIAERGLADRVRFAKVWPGPLPLPPASFDVVFSKDAIVHISDKHALMADAFRILRPGGWLAASDWLIGHAGDPSPAMRDYLAAEGLDFGMAAPARYRDALARAGFAEITLQSRNAWYRQRACDELAAMQGPLRPKLERELGAEFVSHNLDIWTKMLAVLDTGEHCPTLIRARKPPE